MSTLIEAKIGKKSSFRPVWDMDSMKDYRPTLGGKDLKEGKRNIFVPINQPPAVQANELKGKVPVSLQSLRDRLPEFPAAKENMEAATKRLRTFNLRNTAKKAWGNLKSLANKFSVRDTRKIKAEIREKESAGSWGETREYIKDGQRTIEVLPFDPHQPYFKFTFISEKGEKEVVLVQQDFYIEKGNPSSFYKVRSNISEFFAKNGMEPPGMIVNGDKGLILPNTEENLEIINPSN